MKIRVEKESTEDESVLDLLNENQKQWWNDIKDLQIELYGLSDRHISDVASPCNLLPSQLNLKVTAPAGIVAIEQALAQFRERDPNTRAVVAKYMMKTDAGFVLVKPTEGTLKKTGSGKYIFVPDEW